MTKALTLGGIVIASALAGACSSPADGPATTTPATPTTTTANEAPPPTTAAPATTATPASAADYATLCPVLADTRPIGGTGPSVNPDASEVDVQALDDAFVAPEGWTLGEMSFIARGMAGHASSQISRPMTRGEDRVVVGLIDLMHVCRCHEGDGVALRDRDVAGNTAERTARAFGGSPGLVESRAGGGASVRVWVGDRCMVTFDGGDAAALTTIADATSWPHIAERCVHPSS
jgi:hypothetical protein